MYDRDFSSLSDNMIFGTAIIGMILLFLLIGVVCYIFLSIGLMKMAENAGIKNSWLAWIPIGNTYIIGELVTIKLNGNGGQYALWASVGGLILGRLPLVGWIFSMGLFVFCCVLYYWIYQKYSQNPALHLIFSIILPPYAAFAIFALRSREPSY